MKLKKIKKFNVGLRQIIIEVITGLLTTLVLNLLSIIGWLPDNIHLFVSIFLMVGNVLLVKSMLSWGIFYTIGWLIGSIIFYNIGLLGSGPWVFILYIVLPLAVLVTRVTLVIKRKVAA